MSSASTQGSLFLTNIVVARLLGRDGFGEFGIVYSTLLAFSAVAQLATGFTATRYVAEYRSIDKRRTGRILALCSIITMVTGVVASLSLIIGSQWFAVSMFMAPHLANSLVIAAVYVLFSVMNGYQVGALAGLESYRRLANRGIISGVIHLVLCGSAAGIWGRDGAFGGLAASSLARWFVFRAALKLECQNQGIELRHQDWSSERRIFVHFALPAAIAGMSSMPAMWFANTVLVQQVGGYAQMGLYGAAANLKNLVLFLPMLLNSVGTAVLNNQKGEGNSSREQQVLRDLIITTAIIVTGGAILVALLGSSVLALYGVEFVAAYPVLLVLLVAALFEAVGLSVYQIIQSQERMWLSFGAITLPRDGIIIVLGLFLIPKYGATGLAVSYAFAGAFACAATIVSARLIEGKRVISEH